MNRSAEKRVRGCATKAVVLFEIAAAVARAAPVVCRVTFDRCRKIGVQETEHGVYGEVCERMQPQHRVDNAAGMDVF